MMRRLITMLLLAGLTTAPLRAMEAMTGEAPRQPLPDPVHEPVRLVRLLQALQVSIAQGDKASYAAQPQMLRTVARGLAEAPASAWQHPRNRYAAVAFALGGGDAETVRKVIEACRSEGVTDEVLEGALAYLEGRQDAAAEALAKADLLALPAEVGAPLALARGSLATLKDQPEALHMLAMARLLLPGGLVEEAALRRELGIHGTLGSADDLVRLAATYMRRFPRSMFAEDFQRRVVATLIGLNGFTLQRWIGMQPVLGRLPPATARELFLGIARAALSSGHFEVADFASRHVLNGAPDEDERRRALLYRSAALLGEKKFEEARALFWSLDERAVAEKDRLLHRATRSVIQRLSDADPVALPESPAAAPARSGEADGLARATAAIARAETLLQEATRWQAPRPSRPSPARQTASPQAPSAAQP